MRAVDRAVIIAVVVFRRYFSSIRRRMYRCRRPWTGYSGLRTRASSSKNVRERTQRTGRVQEGGWYQAERQTRSRGTDATFGPRKAGRAPTRIFADSERSTYLHPRVEVGARGGGGGAVWQRARHGAIPGSRSSKRISTARQNDAPVQPLPGRTGHGPIQIGGRSLEIPVRGKRVSQSDAGGARVWQTRAQPWGLTGQDI